MEPSQRVRPSSWPQRLLVLAVLCYVAALLVLPFGALVARVARVDPAALVNDLLTAEVAHALGLSICLAIIAGVVNGLFGLGAAVVFVRQRFAGQRFFDALADLPLSLSPIMVGLAFILLFGRHGWLEAVAGLLSLKLTFSFGGLVLATLFVTLPFTLREVSHILAELGLEEEEAAVILGASPWQAFRRVTLPNVRQALGYGITLTVARSLGEFGAVLVVGGAISGKTQTATTFINTALEERRDDAAFTMALVLAVLSILVWAALEVLKRRRARG
jgi:sulfate transport system permease protein